MKKIIIFVLITALMLLSCKNNSTDASTSPDNNNSSNTGENNNNNGEDNDNISTVTQEELDKYGIDIDTATTEKVKEALNQYYQATPMSIWSSPLPREIMTRLCSPSPTP